MKAHWPACSVGSSIRFRCPAARLLYPTAQGSGRLSALVYCLLRSQARACFVCESSVGDPTLRSEATGICVVPWEEAPGDPRAGLLGPSEAFGLSPSLLIPGRAPFARCAARSASTIWLSHLAPSCWYLTRPTLLLVQSPKNQLCLPSSVRLIDRNRSLHSLRSCPFSSRRLCFGRWLLKRSPPSQLPDPAVRHSAASPVPATAAPASHNKPTPPRPPSLTPPPPCRVRVHAATYRTAPRERQRQQLAGDQVAGTRPSACRGQQRRPVASPRSHRIPWFDSPVPAQQHRTPKQTKGQLKPLRPSALGSASARERVHERATECEREIVCEPISTSVLPSPSPSPSPSVHSSIRRP
jgi:hypothetical protein